MDCPAEEWQVFVKVRDEELGFHTQTCLVCRVRPDGRVVRERLRVETRKSLAQQVWQSAGREDVAGLSQRRTVLKTLSDHESRQEGMEGVSVEKRDTAVYGRKQVSVKPDPPMWWRRHVRNRARSCSVVET